MALTKTDIQTLVDRIERMSTDINNYIDENENLDENKSDIMIDIMYDALQDMRNSVQDLYKIQSRI